jgi:predicted nuclease with TOPRIM domain
MTTATKESEGAQLAALREARERLEEARRERAQLDAKARTYSHEVARAQAEYERLAHAEQEQFDDAASRSRGRRRRS